MSVRRDVQAQSHGSHVDPEMVLVDLEATVASIDNSRLLVTPKTADINSELLRDLLGSRSKAKEPDQISQASSQDSLERMVKRVSFQGLRFVFLLYFALLHFRDWKMK